MAFWIFIAFLIFVKGDEWYCRYIDDEWRVMTDDEWFRLDTVDVDDVCMMWLWCVMWGNSSAVSGQSTPEFWMMKRQKINGKGQRRFIIRLRL